MSTTPTTSTTPRRFLVLIFLLVLALRVTPVLLAFDLPISLDDMLQYDSLARSIVAGNGYRWYAENDLALIEPYVTMERPAGYDPRGVPTSFRAPGHSAFLAEPRFHVPLLPVIAVLAAYAFVESPWRWSHPWQRKLSALLVMLLLVNWGLELARDWNALAALFGPEGHRLYPPY
jgi:hypothetical protein